MQLPCRALFIFALARGSSSFSACENEPGLCFTGPSHEHVSLVQRHAAAHSPSKRSTSNHHNEEILACTSSGDPHTHTFVGNKHNFQGIGEYVLVSSRNNEFRVHTCQQQWSGAKRYPMSVNEGFVVRLRSCTVVCIFGKDCATYGEQSGCADVKVQKHNVTFPTGEIVARGENTANSNAIVVKVPADLYRNQVEGLCGAYNSPDFDDTCTNSCGDNIPCTACGDNIECSATIRQAGNTYFAENFGETWRVDPGASFFPASDPCEGQIDTTKASMVAPAPFANCEGLRAQAEAACLAAGDAYDECMEDVGITCELSEWVAESVFADEVAKDPDVEKPSCKFDITATPAKYGESKTFQWVGTCGPSFLIQNALEGSSFELCRDKFSLGAYDLMTSTGQNLGFLSCANQTWSISEDHTPSLMPSPAPTAGLAATSAPTATPAVFQEMCKHPSWEFEKIKTGACSDHGRSPIHDKTACEMAAEALGLHDTKASTGTWDNRPEGCYYEPGASTNARLQFNVGGEGLGPDDAREQICGPTAATAVGDPHLVNTRGEHFSIFKSGQVEFIRVPYESVTEEADLTVHATIQSFGETDKCKEALYIAGLRFDGSWFKGKPLEVNVDFIRPGATRKEMQVLLGSVPVVPSTDPIDVGDKMALHMQDNKKIVLVVDGASVAVDLQDFFLNVKADSFSKLSQKIGGLLGYDDHSAFSTKPAGCEEEVLPVLAKAAQRVYSSASCQREAGERHWGGTDGF